MTRPGRRCEEQSDLHAGGISFSPSEEKNGASDSKVWDTQLLKDQIPQLSCAFMYFKLQSAPVAGSHARWSFGLCVFPRASQSAPVFLLIPAVSCISLKCSSSQNLH
ncbi:hypothetical protein MHYP_G00019950 [Metynnis hypsauchen]